jgi:hypothetical protein
MVVIEQESWPDIFEQRGECQDRKPRPRGQVLHFGEVFRRLNWSHLEFVLTIQQPQRLGMISRSGTSEQFSENLPGFEQESASQEDPAALQTASISESDISLLLGDTTGLLPSLSRRESIRITWKSPNMISWMS